MSGKGTSPIDFQPLSHRRKSHMLIDKRLILAMLLITGVTINFWASSREQQLNEKTCPVPHGA
jgi:hypothetical protein